MEYFSESAVQGSEEFKSLDENNALEMIGPVSGRYDILGDQLDSTQFRQVTLRVGGDRPEVSCDMFESGQSSSRKLLLGGRSDWHSSLRGLVTRFRSLPNGTLQLFAACERTRDGELPRDGAPSDAEINLVIDPNKGSLIRASARTARMQSSSDSDFVDSWNAKPKGRRDAFRRIRMFYVILPKVPTETKDRIRQHLFSNSGPASVVEALRLEGVSVDASEKDLGSLKYVAAQRSDTDEFDDITASILSQLSLDIVGQPRSDHLKWDWQMLLVFAGLEDKSSNSDRRSHLVIGRAHGFDEPRNRFRSRFGAIINTTRVKDELGKSQRNDVDDETWSLRHYALHEIGHLLNFPHPWRRRLGDRSLGPDDPAAMSWMNYGSRFPFGLLAQAQFSSLADRDAVTDARRDKFFGCLGHGSYSHSERRFICHAPLDQIAQGGRTFLDHNLDQPKLMPPNGDDKVKLEFVVPVDGQLLPVKRIAALEWRIGLSAVEFAPIPVLVRLTGSDAKGLGVESLLATGAIQLILQEDVDIDPKFGSVRRVRAYDQQTNGVQQSQKSAAVRTQIVESLIDRIQRLGPQTPLPWIRRDEIHSLFSRSSSRFVCQLQYYRGAKSIYSDLLSVRFDTSVELGKNLSEARKAVNDDDQDFFEPLPLGRGLRAVLTSGDAVFLNKNRSDTRALSSLATS